jgi:hypothetical protein
LSLVLSFDIMPELLGKLLHLVYDQRHAIYLSLLLILLTTYLVWRKNTWSKRVRVLKARTGVFVDQGEEFFREAVGHPLYRRSLVAGTVGIDGVESRNYTYTIVKASQTESALSGRPKPIPVRELPEQSFFVVHEDPNPVIRSNAEAEAYAVAVGFRYTGGHGVAPRHAWNCGDITIRANSGREYKLPPDVKAVMYSDVVDYNATAADLVFFPVPPGIWAWLGIKEVSRKSFSRLSTGPFTVTGCTEEGNCLKSEGFLLGNETEEIHNRGLISHTAFTDHGFSGTLCKTTEEGTTKFRGVHIAGKLPGQNHNFAISAEAFLTAARELGIDPSITVDECMMPESREPKSKQREWSLARMYRKCEADTDYVLTQDEIDQYGRDIGGEHVATIMQVNAYERAHEYQPNGYGSSQSYGRVSKVGRQLWSDMLDESIKLEQAPLFVSTLGERLYRRTVEDVSIPVATKDQAKATDEQVSDLMRRVFEGDTTAITEAKGLTHESVLATPSMFYMREYLTNTPVEVDVGGENQIMLDKSGKPFFSRYGKYKYHSRKKKKDDENNGELKGIPPSAGLEYAKEAGLNTEWYTAPRNKESIKSTLRQQAATIEQPPDLSPFEVDGAMNIWKEMLDVYPAADCNLLQEGVKGFEKVMNTFEHKSSGWTARAKNADKKSLAEKNKPWLMNLTCARILLRATCSHLLPTMHPAAKVEMGLRDPAQAETKDEPYPAAKADKSFWRVIWVASCLDTMVQGVLHHNQNKTDIAGYQDGKFHWSLAGLGHDDKGIQRLGGALEEMMEEGDTLFSEDASRYDLTQSREFVLLDGERRVYLEMKSERENGRAPSPGLYDALMHESFCNTSHMLAFEGEYWLVHHLGLTQSGVKSTTAQNCFSRTFGVKLASGGNGGSLGDDNVSKRKPDAKVMKALGIIQKPGGIQAGFKEGVPITSHLIKKRPDGTFTAEFLNLDKMVARLLMKYTDVAPEPQVIGSCLFVTRNSIYQQMTIRKLCAAMKWPLAEAELYKDAPCDIDDD